MHAIKEVRRAAPVVVVDLAELSATVDRAVDFTRQALAERQDAEARQTAKLAAEANQAAEQIISRIPSALKEAAAGVTALNRPSEITAEITVAKERMTSIMDTKGYLSNKDTLVVAAVKAKLNDLTLENSAVELCIGTFTGGFMSADGLDEASGPCKHYYLKVCAKLPERS